MDNGPVHGVVDWLGVGWVPVSVFVCVYVCTSVNNELIRKFVSLRILSLSPYPFPSSYPYILLSIFPSHSIHVPPYPSSLLNTFHFCMPLSPSPSPLPCSSPFPLSLPSSMMIVPRSTSPLLIVTCCSTALACLLFLLCKTEKCYLMSLRLRNGQYSFKFSSA